MLQLNMDEGLETMISSHIAHPKQVRLKNILEYLAKESIMPVLFFAKMSDLVWSILKDRARS